MLVSTLDEFWFSMNSKTIRLMLPIEIQSLCINSSVAEMPVFRIFWIQRLSLYRPIGPIFSPFWVIFAQIYLFVEVLRPTQWHLWYWLCFSFYHLQIHLWNVKHRPPHKFLKDFMFKIKSHYFEHLLSSMSKQWKLNIRSWL